MRTFLRLGRPLLASDEYTVIVTEDKLQKQLRRKTSLIYSISYAFQSKRGKERRKKERYVVAVKFCFRSADCLLFLDEREQFFCKIRISHTKKFLVAKACLLL